MKSGEKSPEGAFCVRCYLAYMLVCRLARSTIWPAEAQGPPQKLKCDNTEGRLSWGPLPPIRPHILGRCGDAVERDIIIRS